MEKMKDSEVLARLIYRAYIQPDPHAPLEAEALLPFQSALDLYARTARNETPPMLVAKDIPDEMAKEICNRLGIVSDSGTEEKVHVYGYHRGHIISADVTMPSDTPPPAPKRTKSETGMRGLNGGKCTEEKREIYARLMAFVAAHGLGSRRMVAEASSGKLTLANVQDMTDARQVDVRLWRAAAAAMDRIEKEEDHAEEEI